MPCKTKNIVGFFLRLYDFTFTLKLHAYAYRVDIETIVCLMIDTIGLGLCSVGIIYFKIFFKIIIIKNVFSINY